MLNRQKNAFRDGMTFVEILISVVILGILAIAGGALVERGQIDVGTQKYKRAAIEAASGQLEKVVHEWAYSNVLNAVGTSSNTFISLNNISGFKMITSFENANNNGDNCIKISVSVEYRKNGGTVDLVTYRSPGGT